jgi:hypothetical protein
MKQDVDHRDKPGDDGARNNISPHGVPESRQQLAPTSGCRMGYLLTVIYERRAI